MSILSDRRSLREIGGVRAYIRQVGWSLWWRTRPVAGSVAQTPPSLLLETPKARVRRPSEAREPLRNRHAGSPPA